MLVQLLLLLAYLQHLNAYIRSWVGGPSWEECRLTKALDLFITGGNYVFVQSSSGICIGILI